MNRHRFLILFLVFGLLSGLHAPAQETARTVHVFVALCDNEHQGIQKVPAALGDGEDPANNLYWGALYGVKTVFGRSEAWTLVKTVATPREGVLERLVFRHATADVYLVADAYRGIEIKRAIGDFLAAVRGEEREALTIRSADQDVTIHIGGGASLMVYIGHNGLMEFEIDEGDATDRADSAEDAVSSRDAVVLCCASKSYFAERLARAGVRALLLTTGLMAPEAYTLEAALEGWIAGETVEQIRLRAAHAYDEHQDCSFAAAKRLFDVEEE